MLKKATVWLTFFCLQAGSPVMAAPEADQASLEAGRKLFRANCKKCHGPEGRGDGPAAATLTPRPRNLQEEPLQGGEDDEQIFNTITQGRPGTGMPSFPQLTVEDRWLLVAHVKRLRRKS